MLDHVFIPVTHLAQSIAFYEKTLGKRGFIH